MKALIFSLGICMGALAQAATLTINFDSIYTSSGTPAGPGPWAVAVLSDSGAGTVDLTLSCTTTSPNEFLSMLRLNVDPSVSSIATSVLSDPQGSYNGGSYNQNGFTDAGTTFDYTLDLKTAFASRLSQGDSISVRLTGTGLDVNKFNTLSSGGNPVLALVHLQGIDGGFSAKLAPVPEPATMLLGLPALALVLRKRIKA